MEYACRVRESNRKIQIKQTENAEDKAANAQKITSEQHSCDWRLDVIRAKGSSLWGWRRTGRDSEQAGLQLGFEETMRFGRNGIPDKGPGNWGVNEGILRKERRARRDPCPADRTEKSGWGVNPPSGGLSTCGPSPARPKSVAVTK